MRICHVFQDDYPWDVRVEKISVSLAEAGHPTVIVSRNRRGLPRRQTLRANLDVVRLPIGLTALDRTIANFPAFFSPWWLNAIVQTVRRERSELILVRDLPLAPTAVWAGRLTGTPVVMDMAENYPAMLQATADFGQPSAIDRIVRNPDWLRKLERWIMPQLDGVFTVSDASRRRVVQLTNGAVPVWVVGNVPRLETLDAVVPSALADRLRAHAGLVLLYVGGMDAKRGLDDLVRSLALIKLSEPNVLAVIVGKGTMEPKLRAIARELAVEENLLLTGWVDSREVPALLEAADIGVIPHLLTEHTDTTIPNKIFDYMAKELPVVVTHCTTLREIVESTGCGRVCRDRDPASLADSGVVADRPARPRGARRGRPPGRRADVPLDA